MFSDNNYPIKANPRLKNGLHISDVYDVFDKYNLRPLDGTNRFLGVEFMLLIGFEDEKDQKHFEAGLDFLRKDSGYIIKSK